MIYDIVQVVPFDDYTVYVYFEDGKIVCYDAKPLLDKKVFEPLRDKDFFFEFMYNFEWNFGMGCDRNEGYIKMSGY